VDYFKFKWIRNWNTDFLLHQKVDWDWDLEWLGIGNNPIPGIFIPGLSNTASGLITNYLNFCSKPKLLPILLAAFSKPHLLIYHYWNYSKPEYTVSIGFSALAFISDPEAETSENDEAFCSACQIKRYCSDGM